MTTDDRMMMKYSLGLMLGGAAMGDEEALRMIRVIAQCHQRMERRERRLQRAVKNRAPR